ncbi:hypothetical protein ANCDUO_26804, partial [Ancylostoma duodenale]
MKQQLANYNLRNVEGFKEVAEILVDDGAVRGVRLADRREIHAETVLSNATPKVTFEDLVAESHLTKEFLSEVKSIDYTSPVTKINGCFTQLELVLSL